MADPISASSSKSTSNDDSGFYGLLDKPNIKRVVFGKYEFSTWYGNAAYFNSHDVDHSALGYVYTNKVASDPTLRARKRSRTASKTPSKTPAKTPAKTPTSTTNNDNVNSIISDNGNASYRRESVSSTTPVDTDSTHGTIEPEDANGSPLDNDSFWLDELYVCDYCFKYTTNAHEISQHRAACVYNTPKPIIGRLLYRDDNSPYLIREVRGFKNSLFCQNLCLFGKLFLDDKSVYYNIDYFNFYIVYGYDENDNSEADPDLPPYEERQFKPMGFFSKEILSYDTDNNLACICVFPPFQRRHLGSLMIEFSYELAKVTPGQLRSGPEFPLSPYGKVSYLKYWSKKLSHLITANLKAGMTFSINDLSDLTGFRKEDILLTLEYMKLLKKDSRGNVKLLLGNLEKWCIENRVDPNQEKSMLNTECLLI
ncbi:acyl-CoA N-acyltransferase [Scheffersomyces xylosifermentans]|uniref:acyl-CoA N-acyltransferase n=1 Tax=Scheffersomyces xylosifermentans TaxID=1304137 RepID=UPI00315DE2C1